MATKDQPATDLESEDDARPALAVRYPALRVLLPVGRTLADWWREMLTMGAASFVWLLLSLTVIGGPPAGAALYASARGTALHQYVDIRFFIGALRQYFLKSWILGLIGLFGIAFWWLDLNLYLSMVGGGLLALVGGVIIFYVGVIGLNTLNYAWAMMVCRDDLTVPQLLRNGVILSLRFPATTIVTGIVAGMLLVAAIYVPPLIGLVIPALVALMGLHNLYLLAPELVSDDVDTLHVVG